MIRPQESRKIGRLIVPVNGQSHVLTVAEDKYHFQFLTCPCSSFERSEWCEHISIVYTHPGELDSANISNCTLVQMFKAPHSMFVPLLIMPMGAGEIKAASERMTSKVPISYSEVVVPFGKTKKLSSTFVAEEKESIGYITANQGRRSLRRMTFDWLLGVPYSYAPRMKCASTTHTIGQCYFDLNDADNPPGGPKADSWRHRDAFTLLEVGECYACAEIKLVDD